MKVSHKWFRFKHHIFYNVPKTFAGNPPTGGKEEYYERPAKDPLVCSKYVCLPVSAFTGKVTERLL